jgi:hypothetical protein
MDGKASPFIEIAREAFGESLFKNPLGGFTMSQLPVDAAIAE